MHSSGTLPVNIFAPSSGEELLRYTSTFSQSSPLREITLLFQALRIPTLKEVHPAVLGAYLKKIAKLIESGLYGENKENLILMLAYKYAIACQKISLLPLLKELEDHNYPIYAPIIENHIIGKPTPYSLRESLGMLHFHLAAAYFHDLSDHAMITFFLEKAKHHLPSNTLIHNALCAIAIEVYHRETSKERALDKALSSFQLSRMVMDKNNPILLEGILSFALEIFKSDLTYATYPLFETLSDMGISPEFRVLRSLIIKNIIPKL